jgi:hypothetical protein
VALELFAAPMIFAGDFKNSCRKDEAILRRKIAFCLKPSESQQSAALEGA